VISIADQGDHNVRQSQINRGRHSTADSIENENAQTLFSVLSVYSGVSQFLALVQWRTSDDRVD
jgi:hypothetical protein